MGVELGHRLIDVGLDGMAGEGETVRDAVIGQAFTDQDEDLFLALAQSIDGGLTSLLEPLLLRWPERSPAPAGHVR
jgi:hypothetical protein